MRTSNDVVRRLTVTVTVLVMEVDHGSGTHYLSVLLTSDPSFWVPL